eukprot:CAMPEP_0182924446 /NCGR_PEP_ID=MMETSP0105_2-20130417/6048_1 /TAXON_ID=81532 ORGANISM="Acanthoeca-like sp., Strain 10tr" /NCGR_SAMPLE_ID=MMETSP0105_2 /ASSEMBLY_ACC=CAM_ASM_000205 /LENGTH=288 /DNA_ID=CAMNT_0025062221 /DNA_START=39 /DNA_END=904 /DNA_ORIENTATION=-
MTVYHTNQANYSAGDIANMNTADALGDIEFTVRAKIIPLECADPTRASHAPWDCENPEQDAHDLAITKLIIQVNSDAVKTYCPCNVHAGIYSCVSHNSSNTCGGVGAISVYDFLGHVYDPSRFGPTTPHYEWYALNTLRRFGSGMWYSTLGSAQCAPGKETTALGAAVCLARGRGGEAGREELRGRRAGEGHRDSVERLLPRVPTTHKPLIGLLGRLLLHHSTRTNEWVCCGSADRRGSCHEGPRVVGGPFRVRRHFKGWLPKHLKMGGGWGSGMESLHSSMPRRASS